jgi:hypothetical protein
MDETTRDDIPQVSREENEILMAPFTRQEIRSVIFQMEHNTKAPLIYLVKEVEVWS